MSFIFLTEITEVFVKSEPILFVMDKAAKDEREFNNHLMIIGSTYLFTFHIFLIFNFF